jgi:hypothetical protein
MDDRYAGTMSDRKSEVRSLRSEKNKKMRRTEAQEINLDDRFSLLTLNGESAEADKPRTHKR